MCGCSPFKRRPEQWKDWLFIYYQNIQFPKHAWLSLSAVKRLVIRPSEGISRRGSFFPPILPPEKWRLIPSLRLTTIFLLTGKWSVGTGEPCEIPRTTCYSKSISTCNVGLKFTVCSLYINVLLSNQEHLFLDVISKLTSFRKITGFYKTLSENPGC